MSTTENKEESWHKCGICSHYLRANMYRRHFLLKHQTEVQTRDNITPKQGTLAFFTQAVPAAAAFFHNSQCIVKVERKTIVYLPLAGTDDSEEESVNENPSSQRNPQQSYNFRVNSAGYDSEADQSYQDQGKMANSMTTKTTQDTLPKIPSNTSNQAKQKRKVKIFTKKKKVYEKDVPTKCVKCLAKFPNLARAKDHQVKCKVRPECKICHKTFRAHTVLVRHNKSHSEIKEYLCVFCNKLFSGSTKLQEHIIVIHTKERPFKCNTCERLFPLEKHLKQHSRIHSDKTYYDCPHCDKKFKQNASLYYHLKQFHLGGAAAMKKVCCSVCNTMVTANGLRRHIQSKHTGERPFQCDICKLKFARQDQLKCHSRVHSDKTYYNCSECGETFKFLATLNLHIEQAHTSEENRRKFHCTHCKESFVSKNKLETHKSQAHGIQRSMNFECLFCGKKMHSSTSLENHYRMHLREKPFICKICGSSFDQRSNFNSHMNIHDESYQKPLGCDRCPRRFVDKGQLAVHLKIHDDIKDIFCELCDKAFRSQYALHMHIKKHIEDRPYKCNYCGKAFKFQKSLKTHEMLHRGDKPYACEVCGKSYTQRVNLNSHREKFH
ncbi:unnamed protein product [Orchesella dallaii]|uniref:C2H2-type domain-containing protein n=1 Tax=Orchesella dallaii TaxID=48710 RepID=A0ABP1RNK7_9HEXA